MFALPNQSDMSDCDCNPNCDHDSHRDVTSPSTAPITPTNPSVPTIHADGYPISFVIVIDIDYIGGF